MLSGVGMVIERLNANQVDQHTVRALGHDPTTSNLSKREIRAGLLRRAASFLCPTSTRVLVRAVLNSLRGLEGIGDDAYEELRALTQDLVGYGDLLELPVGEEELDATRQLFLAPPSFVLRESSSCLLVGIRSDGESIVGEDLAREIESRAHIRMLRFKGAEIAEETCLAHGLRKLPMDHWLRSPTPVSATQLVNEYDLRLSASGPAGDIADVRVLNSERPVTYYRGRWEALSRSHSGRFVGRRPQAYGADLWCYFEIEDGQIARLIDLPVKDPLARGCDEAWRLQAAIDSVRGNPQVIRSGHLDARIWELRFLSPPPSWVQRRLDVVGIPSTSQKGAVVSYSLEKAEAQEEISFLEEMMWTKSEELQKTS